MNQNLDYLEELQETQDFVGARWYFERRPQTRASISGIVEAIEWNEWDEVTRVCIFSEKEETEYEVAENSKGKELIHLVGFRVKARGVIDHLRKDIFEIRVAEYEVL